MSSIAAVNLQLFFDIPKVSQYSTHTITVQQYTVAYSDGMQPYAA